MAKIKIQISEWKDKNLKSFNRYSQPLFTDSIFAKLFTC